MNVVLAVRYLAALRLRLELKLFGEKKSLPIHASIVEAMATRRYLLMREQILNANGSLDVTVLDTDIALPIYIDFPLIGTKIIGLTTNKEHLPAKAVVRIKLETLAARLALADSVSSGQQPYYAKVEIHPSEPGELLKFIDKFKEEKEHQWRDLDADRLNPELQRKVRERCELESRWVKLYS